MLVIDVIIAATAVTLLRHLLTAAITGGPDEAWGGGLLPISKGKAVNLVELTMVTVLAATCWLRMHTRGARHTDTADFYNRIGKC